ncbi:MAG: hypothetical protein GWN01_01290 [Nitrosopumilaceae archaeon]|nr:hypothetical protein [Nitrosopumilaceae archaeon]NIU85993.1 hypothetical protein [Nitrosopumilaceae archaeon]NIX60212.1 hypothetical protein [Nitrosopumilaceae archaeon]
MTDETSQEQKDSTQVQKSTDVEAVLKATEANTKAIESITKSVSETSEGLKTVTKGVEALLKKAEDANPVDHGTDKEQKPKESDPDDAGDKDKKVDSYAPKGDAQSSIDHKDNTKPGTDTVDKAEEKTYDKEDETKRNKEEVAKTDDKKEDEYKDTKKSDVRKAVSPDGEYEYTIVNKARPKYDPMPSTPQNAPTAYQVLDAINKGWGGKYTSYEQSFTEAMNRLEKGEFGTGFPDGGVV